MKIKSTFDGLASFYNLAQQFDNLTAGLEIDCSGVTEDGDTAAVLIRGVDGSSYPALSTYEDGILKYAFTAADLKSPGNIYVQLAIYGPAGEVKHSKLAALHVARSIPGDEEPPEALKAWLDEAARTLENLKKYGSDAEKSAVAAALSEKNAAGSASAAQSAQAAAETAQTAAEEARDASAASATSAAQSAQTSTDKAQEIADSAEQIEQNKTDISQLRGDIATVNTRLDNIDDVIIETVEPLQKQADRTERSLSYLWKKSQGIIYDTETVESMAAENTVPTGAMEYAETVKVGGMSRQGKNLFHAVSGTVDNTTGEFISYNASSTKSVACEEFIEIGSHTSIQVTKVIAIIDDPNTSKSLMLRLYDADKQYLRSILGLGSSELKREVSFGSEAAYFRAVMFADVSGLQNIINTYCPMISYDEAAYEPYTDRLINSSVDRITAKNTILIPDAIQTLPDYGIGIDADCYNYFAVEGDRLKYHRRVGSYQFTGADGLRLMQNAPLYTSDTIPGLQNAKIITKQSAVNLSRILIPGFVSTDQTRAQISTNGVALSAWNNSVYLYFSSKRYADVSELNNYLVGKSIYFELAEEEVIDITELISDADWNILQVEPGDTVKFHCPAQDDGYKVEVPNTIEYMVEVAKA